MATAVGMPQRCRKEKLEERERETDREGKKLLI
jgi:hypothetical protein